MGNSQGKPLAHQQFKDDCTRTRTRTASYLSVVILDPL